MTELKEQEKVDNHSEIGSEKDGKLKTSTTSHKLWLFQLYLEP